MALESQVQIWNGVVHRIDTTQHGWLLKKLMNLNVVLVVVICII